MDRPPLSVTLRPWRDDDLAPYTAMNADPEVMRYFPKTLTAEESRESYQYQRRLLEERGWGIWVVDVDGVFAGFTGLAVPRFAAPFQPCVEIGWRLRREFWGRGFAGTAARQAERHAFAELKLDELVTFTAAINSPSIRLMERLGFTRDLRGDFWHPSLPPDSPLRLHVLYRKRRAQWTPPAAG